MHDAPNFRGVFVCIARTGVIMSSRLDKAGVVGSRPTRPTIPPSNPGGLAQLGEHLLCKQGVVGSIPSSSTTSSQDQNQSALGECFDVGLVPARRVERLTAVL